MIYVSKSLYVIHCVFSAIRGVIRVAVLEWLRGAAPAGLTFHHTSYHQEFALPGNDYCSYSAVSHSTSADCLMDRSSVTDMNDCRQKGGLRNFTIEGSLTSVCSRMSAAVTAFTAKKLCSGFYNVSSTHLDRCFATTIAKDVNLTRRPASVSVMPGMGSKLLRANTSSRATTGASSAMARQMFLTLSGGKWRSPIKSARVASPSRMVSL